MRERGPTINHRRPSIGMNSVGTHSIGMEPLDLLQITTNATGCTGHSERRREEREKERAEERECVCVGEEQRQRRMRRAENTKGSERWRGAETAKRKGQEHSLTANKLILSLFHDGAVCGTADAERKTIPLFGSFADQSSRTSNDNGPTERRFDIEGHMIHGTLRNTIEHSME